MVSAMYNDRLVRFLAEDHAADLLREADRSRLAETARQAPPVRRAARVRRAATERLADAGTSLGRSARAGAASVRRARAW
jgi:hypothetical protein